MEKTTMTVDKLEAYKGLVSNMQVLQQEISALRNTYRSPRISDVVGSHVMSVGSSPTEAAVSKIFELEQIYNKEYEAAANLLYEIETWLSQADPEIRAIARFHYVLGYSWERTNTAVCGYPSQYTARKRLMRYLNKEA